MKTLIVIDMQNDFITGPLGTPEAREIVTKVKAKIDEYLRNGDQVIFTRDTHYDGYLRTQEGRYLPIEHCIVRTDGWQIISELKPYVTKVATKHGFGYNHWDLNYFDLNFQRNSVHYSDRDFVEVVGVCTDICVISNALILKSLFPETEITVDASCCAGTTPENHKAALQVMKSCQINVIGE